MYKRTITGDEPATGFSTNCSEALGITLEHFSGMPIQLELAKDFMAAHIMGYVHAGFPYKHDELAAEALKDATALLNAYNNQ